MGRKESKDVEEGAAQEFSAARCNQSVEMGTEPAGQPWVVTMPQLVILRPSLLHMVLLYRLEVLLVRKRAML